MKSKFAAAVLLSGALALGTGSAAVAAPTGGSGSTPGSHRAACTRAPEVLARLRRVDSRITTVLPKLQAAEQKAAAAGHTRRADRIEKVIAKLHQRDNKVATRMSKVEGRCPGA